MINIETSKFLKEDIFYIFDEDEVILESLGDCPVSHATTGLEWIAYLSEDGELPALDDGDCIESVDVEVESDSIGTKTLSRAAAVYRAFALFAAGVVDEEEHEVGIVNDDDYDDGTSALDVPLVSAKRKDYRRFRYYDLIRTKLELTEPLRNVSRIAGGEIDEIYSRIEVHEYESDCFPKSICIALSLPPACTVLLDTRQANAMWPRRLFTFVEDKYSQPLRDLIRATEKKLSNQALPDVRQFQNVMHLAKYQAASATENILCAFEGVSRSGKHLLSVINRLQASAARFLVLNDSLLVVGPQNRKAYEKELHDCFADCERLQRDIKKSRILITQGGEHLAESATAIASCINTSADCSFKLREVFTVAFETDSKMCLSLQSLIAENETYTKCINFLNEMSPDRIILFLQRDFTKMHGDLANMDVVCSLLLELTQKLTSKSQRIEQGAEKCT